MKIINSLVECLGKFAIRGKMENIDYQGYSTYLELIGIENINTWKSYISENKLDILNSIDGYENLTDEKN